MSSVGQVADDPSGVCVCEMREFMNEPGASKQITQYQNNNYIQQIRKRKLEEAKLKLRTDVVEASLNPGSPKNEDSVEEFGQDFSISENKSTGEVKLKILRRDVMYIPREVLQESSVFEQVTVLDISNCQIVELEGRIFMQLRNLTKLNAARNKIKYLSGKIGECSRLQMINLDCNLLEMMPSEISQLGSCL